MGPNTGLHVPMNPSISNVWSETAPNVHRVGDALRGPSTAPSHEDAPAPSHQDAPAAGHEHAVVPRKKRPAGSLWFVHIFGILCILLSIGLGSFSFDAKWTRMSLRVYMQPLAKFQPSDTPPQHLDVDFARLILNEEPGQVLSRQPELLTQPMGNWTASTLFQESHPTITDSQILISVFVLAAEKRALLLRTRLGFRQPLTEPLDFSTALICTAIHPPEPVPMTKHLSGVGFIDAPSSIPRQLRDADLERELLLHPVQPEEAVDGGPKAVYVDERQPVAIRQEDSALRDEALRREILGQEIIESGRLISRVARNVSIVYSHGSGRTCVLWRNHESRLRGNNSGKLEMPKMITLTNGFFAPNYPLRPFVEFFILNPLAYIGMVVVVWLHSLGLPQPVSIVHAPRLVVYFCIGLWRAFVLYYGLGILENLTWVQNQASRLDRNVLQLLHLWRDGQKGEVENSVVFDFSDHIVLQGFLLFVVITEGFCAYQFRRRRRASLNRSPPPIASIDNPLEMPAIGVYVYLLGVGTIVALLLYGMVMTAAFFHTPLEVFLAYLVLLVGIFFPFWAAIAFDIGLLRHYFDVFD